MAKPKTKAKRPPSKAEVLAAEWAAICARHSKPLERGAKAKGVVSIKAIPRAPAPPPTTASDRKAAYSPVSRWGPPGTPMQKMAFALTTGGAAGQAFNKGGMQYLTPEDLKEQAKGTHRRRS